MMAIPRQSTNAGRVLTAIAIPLESDPHAASKARRSTRDTLTSWGLGDLADDMVLVVSELVTNAVQHGEGPIVMVLQQRDDTILAEIADTSPSLPVPRTQSTEGESGRGLSLVEAFSDDWGCRTRRRRRGKWVWCSRSLSPVATSQVGQPALPEPEDFKSSETVVTL
ncbi:ATP-binding protein [Streptomyces sp. NBC_01288]|uniref:ATP-binding protein n=1 Tax=Streptomyces sp. NBC_01288 TaxID=2903814 RepID=UPI002E12A08E|nr:ATP-binding protein [Streptomyces sp. NBC_01288]